MKIGAKLCSPENTVNDTMVLALANSTIIEHLTLSSDGDKYKGEDVSNLLVYASANSISLQEASSQLAASPHANTVRNRLDENVLSEIDALEASLNEMLADNLIPNLTRKKQKIAIDLTFLPYHGEAERDDSEIRRSKAKSVVLILQELSEWEFTTKLRFFGVKSRQRVEQLTFIVTLPLML